jgi:lipopolysaccharide transport system ATP-binding protein
VDEVLAVGDAAFQKKCLGKMEEVAKGGRTVLFVTHNMAAVVALCPRSMLLHQGTIDLIGPTPEIAARYQTRGVEGVNEHVRLTDARRHGSGKARFVSLSTSAVDASGSPQPGLATGDDLLVRVEIEATEPVADLNVAVIVNDVSGYRLIDVNTALAGTFVSLQRGERAVIAFHVLALLLRPGTYLLDLWLGRGGIETVDAISVAARITVVPQPSLIKHSETFPGPYQCEFTCDVSHADSER